MANSNLTTPIAIGNRLHRELFAELVIIADAYREIPRYSRKAPALREISSGGGTDLRGDRPGPVGQSSSGGHMEKTKIRKATLMTTEPKTRKAPAAKPTAIDKAIARVEAAQAAYDAAPDNSGETTEPLCAAEIDAAYQLADMPCASDAEFMKKLRFLCAREVQIFGPPTGDQEFATVVIAVAEHLGASP